MTLSRNLLLLTFLVVFSCNEYQTTPLPEPRDISVKEVKDFFNRNELDKKARTKYTPEIQWDSSLFKDISIGESIIFPVKYKKDYYLGASDSTKQYKASLASYGFAYKYENELRLEFVQAIPTTNTKLFTGRIMISDWGGELKRVLIYEDGEFLHDYTASTNNSRGRSRCYETITYYCTKRENEPDDCDPVMYEYYCEEPSSLAGPEPNDYDNGGGGPGGGSGLCKHPALDGVYVRCEDLVTCASGYIPGENGCVPKEDCIGGPCCDANGNLIHDCLDDIPCPGDVVKNMEITSSGASGKNGGRYGCTRGKGSCENGKRVHDGLDLTVSQGTYVFNANLGTVVAIRNNFDRMEYRKRSYGNYVIIESELSDGTKYRLKYNHLDEVSLIVGQTIGTGMIIGRAGTTGNASANAKITPHVHLQARTKTNGVWVKSDPEDYLETEYDDDAKISSSPCD